MTYTKRLASAWSRYEKRNPNWQENLASQPAEEPFMYTVPCTKCGGFGKDTCYSNCFVCESCKAAPHIANFFAAVATFAEQRLAAKKAKHAAKPAEITSAVVYHCTDRQSGDIFYLVQSDTNPGTFYAVRWDESRACWSCQCDSRRPCKHERAVNEVQIAKRKLAAEQAARDKKVSDFFMMQQYGLQLNDAGKMYHFIPAEKLPIPERKCARQYEDWSAPDAPIYASAGQHHNTRLGAREGFRLLK